MVGWGRAVCSPPPLPSAVGTGAEPSDQVLFGSRNTQGNVSGRRWLLRSNYIFTDRTLSPETRLTVGRLVFDQQPRFGDGLATIRAPTKRRFVSAHAKGEGGRVTALPVGIGPASRVNLRQVCFLIAPDFQ